MAMVFSSSICLSRSCKYLEKQHKVMETVNYRPQRSCGKVMFLNLCHSVHGGGVCPSMHRRSHDQGGLCPGSLSRGVSVWRVSIQGHFCQGGSLSGGVSVQGGLCPRGSMSGGSLSRRVSGGSLSRGISVRETSTPYGKERVLCILLECILVE